LCSISALSLLDALPIFSMIFFTALLIVVVAQILSRYFPYQFTWTEELSRYLFVYSMVTAAPVALRKSEFITVDLVPTSLPKNARSEEHTSELQSRFFLV